MSFEDKNSRSIKTHPSAIQIPLISLPRILPTEPPLLRSFNHIKSRKLSEDGVMIGHFGGESEQSLFDAFSHKDEPSNLFCHGLEPQQSTLRRLCGVFHSISRQSGKSGAWIMSGESVEVETGKETRQAAICKRGLAISPYQMQQSWLGKLKSKVLWYIWKRETEVCRSI